jgi:hypothetical protein
MSMTTVTMIVSLVAMLGWLALNFGALRSFQLGPARMVKFALAWIAIFALVALFASRMVG